MRARLRLSRRITYRKIYEHDFDSIGVWLTILQGRATGVVYPWGALGTEVAYLLHDRKRPK